MLLDLTGNKKEIKEDDGRLIYLHTITIDLDAEIKCNVTAHLSMDDITLWNESFSRRFSGRILKKGVHYYSIDYDAHSALPTYGLSLISIKPKGNTTKLLIYLFEYILNINNNINDLDFNFRRKILEKYHDAIRSNR